MKKGFTIAELTVVIVVIGILAAIGIIAYGNWKQSIATNEVKSGLIQLASTMNDTQNLVGTYPSSLPINFNATGAATYMVYGGGASYCGVGQSSSIPAIKYYINQDIAPVPQSSNPGGDCSGH